MQAKIHQPDLGSICPRYGGCAAGYCPAIGGRHLPNEPVCALLREAVKTDAEARLRADIPGNLLERVLRDARRLIRTGGALGRELRRAARHGSQIESGRRLQREITHASPRAAVQP
jgi:hypothetical protein